MLVTLKNDKICVQINSRGAELFSLKKVGDDTEYLWQGDVKYWGDRAINLFPICGRLVEGRYTYAGVSYEMTIHGFAKQSEMEVVSQTEDKAVFRLTANDETRKAYPFEFVYDVIYTLEGNTVKQTFAIQNVDNKELIFGIGGHPGYNVPLEAGECFDDYYVQFDCAKEPKALVMSPTCFFTGEFVPFPLEENGCLSLRHSLFDDDAIFLADVCKAIELKSRKSSRKVRMTYPDMKFLGFWHMPRTDAPYICIEPWSSTPSYDGKVDALETKNEMVHLAPEGTYENTFTITIE